MQYSLEYLVAQLIINWLAERQAQFIKCLRFFLRYTFLAIRCGGVPSTLQILTLDLFQTNNY